MPSSAVALRSEQSLTPAMVATVWEIAGALDEARIPAEVPGAVWLDIPTTRLRGEGSRTDNVWLRECLERLTSVKLSGEHRGEPWGAVVLAEWRIEQGGSLARLLIPPAGVHALRAPANFTKIEAHAAHRLRGPARRLYAILADKKRLGRPSWTFDLAELRALMGVEDQKSYEVWAQFRKRVLDPAVSGINAYGTVEVRMTPEKLGRSVRAVRFDWRWKDPHAAAELAAGAERGASEFGPAKAPRPAETAPPPTPEAPRPNPAFAWWEGLAEPEREAWRDRVGRTMEAAGGAFKRRDSDIACDAWAWRDEVADRQDQADPSSEVAPPAPPTSPELHRAAAAPSAEQPEPEMHRPALLDRLAGGFLRRGRNDQR